MNDNGKDKKDLVKYQDENQMSQAGVTYKEKIESLKITSREGYAEMVQLVRESKAYQQAVKDFFEKIRQKNYDAYQEVLKQIRDYSKPFAEAETIGKQRMRGWEQIEADRARKAQAKAAEKAKEVEEKIGVAPPVAAVQNKAKVAGVTYQDNWKGRIVDKKELLAAILKEKAPLNWVEFNFSEINRFANSTKGQISVPGVEWYNDKIVKVGK